jgi:DNA-binding transcriptional regulator YhcF (GntR family)
MTAVRHDPAKAAIRDRIASGALKPGDRIGRNLSAIGREYGAGKTTMSDVLSEMSTEGLVRSEHGVGYFVADDAVAIIEHQREQQANGDVSALAAHVRDLDYRVAEIYQRLGWEQPAPQEGKADERTG